MDTQDRGGRTGGTWHLELQPASLTAKRQGENFLFANQILTCKHNKVDACTCTHSWPASPTGKALIQLTEDQGHSQLIQGQLRIMAAPGQVWATYDRSSQAVRLIWTKLHETSPVVRSETSGSWVSCSCFLQTNVCVCEGRWTFMKRQQLKARVVSKKEVKRTTGGGKKGWGRREDEREGVADIGRA